MHISPAGLELIKRFEGFRAERYLDSVGVPTIGYGTTAAAGVVEPLPATCTERQASEWLQAYVDRAVIPAIQGAVRERYNQLNQNQIDALCSFVYNLGAGVLLERSTIGHDLRDPSVPLYRVGQDMLLYDHAGSQVLAGLVTRREAERALFDRPVRAVESEA